MSTTIVSGLRALFGRSEPPAPVEPKPQPEIIRPTFEQPVGYGPNGYVNRFLNPDYFATAETAEWIMRRFGAREWFERVAPGNEGPIYTCSHKERWVRFWDGLEMNAGILAAYFKRMPEDQFPGLADRFVWDYIALGRRERAAEVAASITIRHDPATEPNP
jgi:hypothetical protein